MCRSRYSPALAPAGRIDAPLLVENDVNLAALGEQHTGVTRDVPNFAYIYLGAGIGGAIVVDLRLVRGSRGLAGEVGYLPSRADASAERHGLARAIASFGLGPRRRDAWYADTITEARTLLSAAENGDRQALAAVAHAGRALGEAAMAVTAVIDPEVLVLGGPIGIHPPPLRPGPGHPRRARPRPDQGRRQRPRRDRSAAGRSRAGPPPRQGQRVGRTATYTGVVARGSGC